MNIIHTLKQAVLSPMGVMDSKNIGESLPTSVILGVLCALLDAVIFPVLYYLNYRNRYDISLNVGKLLIMLLAATATWLAACAAIWIVSLLYGKGLRFESIAASWGLSYIPDLICLIAYGILQLHVISLHNTISAVLVNTVFIMLLIWKAIFYFIEMRLVLKLEISQLITATIIIGLVFVILMTAGFAIGLQVPML